MRNLKKFETEEEIIAWRKSTEYAFPNLCLVGTSVRYNVSTLLGVFIQHIDGTLYSMADWTSMGFAKEEANGVAVSDIRASFVISKGFASNYCQWSEETLTPVEGLTMYSDSKTAMLDYNGAENTDIIMSSVNSIATTNCANYTFPNGQKGYLPALGEWVVAYEHKEAISEAMSLIGGFSIETRYAQWSSTQSAAGVMWSYHYGSNSSNRVAKSSEFYTRPFGTINITEV